MATRLNPKQDDRTRSAIQTRQLVKRLECFALGRVDDAGNVVDLDANRLRAIDILLRKTLPDLSSVTLSGDENNPIRTEEVGAGMAKLQAFLQSIAERSRDTGPTDAG